MDSSLNRSLTNSQIYDGEYFEVVANEGDILVVRWVVLFWMEIQGICLPTIWPFECLEYRCNICTPDGTDGQLLRTSVKSNGNILKHIKVSAFYRSDLKTKYFNTISMAIPFLLKFHSDDISIYWRKSNQQKVSNRAHQEPLNVIQTNRKSWEKKW